MPFFGSTTGPGSGSTLQHHPCRKALILESQPQIGRGHAGQREKFSRTFLWLAGMPVNGRFHCLPLGVPDVGAAAGADELRLPKSLVQLDRITFWIEPLPFIEDRQVVPAKKLLGGLIVIARQPVDGG